MTLMLEAANSVGLNVNCSKPKLMISSKNQQRHNNLGSNITMGHDIIEIDKNFLFLYSEVMNHPWKQMYREP